MKSRVTSRVHLADQVGEEDEGALQHADHVAAGAGDNRADLCGEVGHPCGNACQRDEDAQTRDRAFDGRLATHDTFRDDHGGRRAAARAAAPWSWCRGATSRRSRPTRCVTGASPSSARRRTRDDAALVPRGRHPARGDRQRSHRRGAQACLVDLPAGAAWPWTRSGRRAAIRSTIPTSPRSALAVSRGEADAGIVIDGAGLGSTMAANKVAGVRAAMCTDADAGALRPRAQRRQRARARRHAAVAPTTRWPSSRRSWRRR